MISWCAIAEGDQISDLLSKYERTTDDSSKIGLLNDIAWEYHLSNPDNTLRYAEMALAQAKEKGIKSTIAESLNLIGIGYDICGDNEMAIRYFKASSRKSLASGNKKSLAGSINNIGLTYGRMGQREKELKYFLAACELGKKIKDFDELGVYYSNIATTFMALNESQKAKEYAEKALNLPTGLNSITRIEIHSILGEIFYFENEKEKALKEYAKAEKLALSSNNKSNLSIVYKMKGKLHMNENNLDEAEQQFHKSLKLSEELDLKTCINEAYYLIGSVLFKKQQYAQSLSYAEKSHKLILEYNDFNLLPNTLKLLSDNYANNKEYSKAYSFYHQYKVLDDSLSSLAKSRQIKEIEIQYGVATQEAENQRLLAIQELSEAKNKRTTYISIITSLCLLMISMLALFLYLSNQRKEAYNEKLAVEVESRTSRLKSAKSELERSYKELERFSYITSHDLKEPLRNIVSFVHLLKRHAHSKLDKESNEYLQYIVKNSKQIYSLIEDVLEYSKLQQKTNSLESVDVEEILDRVKDTLQLKIKEHDVRIVNLGVPNEIMANSSNVFLVMKNLVENAIKYNESDVPRIEISYRLKRNEHVFTIEDNGIGIPKEYHQTIFEMFKRLHSREQYTGSGLGLSICKKIVQSMGGKIWLEETKKEGSCFKFSLPVITHKILTREEFKSKSNFGWNPPKSIGKVAANSTFL